MAVTAEAIIAIMAAEAGLDPARVRPEASLQQLDISSIDLVSAVFALEDQFGIEVDPAAIPHDATVAQFIAHVQAVAGG